MGKLFKHFNILVVTCVLLSSSASALKDPATPERLKEYVKYLASDELEGRLPGTAGIEKAADYIKNHYTSLNLEKFNNSYFQELQVLTGMKLGTENKLSASVLIERAGLPQDQWKPAVRSFAVEADWMPVIFSESGTVSGDLVFAGYGISAETLNYDDFKNIDLKNKIAVILTGSPEGESDKSKFASYVSLRHKAVTARNFGAVAVLFVNSQGDSADVLKSLKFEMLAKNSGIITGQIKRSVIAKLFPKNLQLNFVEKEINKSKKSNSFAIPNVAMTITVDLAEDAHNTKNVIGFVRGTKHPDEYIVVGGHYDHLGWGELGNSAYMGSTPMIHNGADDNASGTAGVMELASRFASNPPERSVVFMAFTGEEMGLLGSAHYVENNFFPHEKTFLMLNFDMIGRMKDNKVQVFGLGSSSSFPRVADSLALLDSIDVIKLNDAFGPSDHSSFYKNQIPVMHLMTEIHSDYHKPSDDWEKLNYQGQAKVIDFAEDVIRHFSAQSARPDYVVVVDTTNKASMRKSGNGAWFGIVPNFEESPDGCKISGSSPGSPAQAAGLIENDVITHINDKLVKNLHDFMFIVGEYKPGDKLKVRILRNKKEMFFDVTLTARKK